MLRQKLFVSGTIIVALIALGVALQQRSEKQKTETELASVQRDKQELKTHLAKLEKQLALAETDVAALIAETSNAKPNATQRVAETAAPVKITKAYVESRYKRAKELAKAGNHSEALAEFLWCYDEGMLRISAYTGVRSSFLLSDIADLGEKYPLALDALRERRNKAELELAAGSTEFEVVQGFKSLNRVLKEQKSTLQYYDRLPEDSAGKRTMGMMIYDELAENQRYREAAEARSFRSMLNMFEDIAESAKPKNGQAGKGDSKFATNLGAGYVEVLAGAGKLADARDLAELIRAYDNSPETAALLAQKAARAGQPNLFAPAPATSSETTTTTPAAKR